MPIHKGMTHIFGAVLEKGFWAEGLTLNRLGLQGKTPDEVIKYITEG